MPESTTERLIRVAEEVERAASVVASAQGCQAIVLVLDNEGAFQLRCAALNINVAVGVLMRAAIACAEVKPPALKVMLERADGVKGEGHA